MIISWQDEIARLSGQTSELEERLRILDTLTQKNKATEESRQQATAGRAAQREPESCPTESEGELASLQLKIKELNEQNVTMKDHMRGKHKRCQLAHKKKMLDREAVYKSEIDKRASEVERLMERNKELQQRCTESVQLRQRAQKLEAKCGQLEKRCRVQGGVCDELRKQLRAADKAAQVADGKQEAAQVAETRQELESRVV